MVMTDRSADLDYIRKFGDKCHAEVSRKGECQACDKTAVAVVIDSEDGHWWPVCAYHTRSRKLVPLADLLRELSANVLGEPDIDIRLHNPWDQVCIRNGFGEPTREGERCLICNPVVGDD